MSDPLVGEIRAFPFSVVPPGWALCDGSLLPIAQNSALFMVLGTTYGGDGQTTFALPDLRGRMPIGHGAAPGLTARAPGEAGGAVAVALTVDQLPPHHHPVAAADVAGSAPIATNALFAQPHARSVSAGYSAAPPTVPLHPATVGPTGEGAAHPNMPPYLALMFCISLTGVFPIRDPAG